jgi:monovalent cation:H+ antiporter, CPA1 family
LTGAGILIGMVYLVLDQFEPHFVAATLAPFLSPALPPEAYLWILLPPILFQAAMEVDVGGMVSDIAPILLLAIVAVVAAALCVGVAMRLTSGENLTVCLLLGAIVSTTDPSTVIALFRRSKVPERLVRLVEGESLFNDAAAITLATVLTSAITLGPDAIRQFHPLARLAVSLVGGGVLGWLTGALFVAVSSALRNRPFSEYTLSLALPNLLYPLAERGLHVSGVVAVVCAGLAAGRLLRAKRPAVHLTAFQRLWHYQASLAGAVVFLLATVQVPALLRDFHAIDALLLCVALAAAVLSRWAVLALWVPLLSRIGLCQPLPRAHQLLIAWGGIRGPVTLTLALCVARDTALPAGPRHFAATMATGFVLLNLLCNGLTLDKVARRLGIARPGRRAMGAGPKSGAAE